VLEKLVKAYVVWSSTGTTGIAAAVAYWATSRQGFVRLVLDLSAVAGPDRRATESPSRLAGLDVRCGSGQTLAGELAGRCTPSSLEFYTSAPERWYYLALSNEQPVHISWVVPAGRRSRLIDLTSGEAEITDCYTVASHRKLGVHRFVVTRILHDLADSGYRRVFAHIAHDNIASFRSFRSLGFEPVGEVIFQRLCGFGRLRYRPGSRTPRGSDS
jgi:RimJ/RimL family protein N-acetyltransferase